MWDWVGIGYLLGPTLRAPYGANNSDGDATQQVKVDVAVNEMNIDVTMMVGMLGTSKIRKGVAGGAFEEFGG